MKFSLSLLKKFIPLELPASKVAEALTELGLEVEAVGPDASPYSGVVAAQIRKAEKHPSAEKLQKLTVFDGNEELQIICGDLQAKEGMHVALAKIGASLPSDEGSFTIKKAKLRGEDSFGMLAAADELHLSDASEGIMTIDPSIPLGTDLTILWDPTFTLSLTPNLGHAESILGIARDLAAYLSLPFSSQQMEIPKRGGAYSVKISSEETIRYTCRYVANIEVKESPFWLKNYLEAAGFRSINNVVDATNYIMLLFGQPMHAFDANKIDGEVILIKEAEKPTSIVTLDGQKREAPEKSLLICDAKKPLAIAGVMGGESSSVTESTKHVLLEAAYFPPNSVRKTSQKLSLRTESSQRFEKGIDREFVPHALSFAAELIKEVAGGEVEEGITDATKGSFEAIIVPCRLERINQILGIKLSLHEVEEIFQRLGFSWKKQQDKLLVHVPSYRHDISLEIDLIEEVARIYGYNNISKKAVQYTGTKEEHHPMYLFEEQIRSRMISLGLTEFLTADLISPALAQIVEEKSLTQENMIRVIHSKSEDYSILRSSLLPSMLQVAQRNRAHKNGDIQAFEIGKIHFKKEEELFEELMVGIILVGKRSQHHFEEKPEDSTFYDLKGVVENLLDSEGVKEASYSSANHPSFHPTRQANLSIDGQLIGALGEIHPDLLESFDLKERVLYAEVNLSLLQSFTKKRREFTPLAIYPSSERDLTVTVRKNLPFSSIESVLQDLTSPRLEKAYLLDLFSPDAKANNVTLRFIYRAKDKTLSYEEVESEHQKNVDQITSKIKTIA